MLKLLERDCAKAIMVQAMGNVAVQVNKNKIEASEYPMYEAIKQNIAYLIKDGKHPIMLSKENCEVLRRYMQGQTQQELSAFIERPQSKVSERILDIRDLLVLMNKRIAKRWPAFASLPNCKNAVLLRKLLIQNGKDSMQLIKALQENSL